MMTEELISSRETYFLSLLVRILISSQVL